MPNGELQPLSDSDEEPIEDPTSEDPNATDASSMDPPYSIITLWPGWDKTTATEEATGEPTATEEATEETIANPDDESGGEEIVDSETEDALAEEKKMKREDRGSDNVEDEPSPWVDNFWKRDGEYVPFHGVKLPNTTTTATAMETTSSTDSPTPTLGVKARVEAVAIRYNGLKDRFNAAEKQIKAWKRIDNNNGTLPAGVKERLEASRDFQRHAEKNFTKATKKWEKIEKPRGRKSAARGHRKYGYGYRKLSFGDQAREDYIRKHQKEWVDVEDVQEALAAYDAKKTKQYEKKAKDYEDESESIFEDEIEPLVEEAESIASGKPSPMDKERREWAAWEAAARGRAASVEELWSEGKEAMDRARIV